MGSQAMAWRNHYAQKREEGRQMEKTINKQILKHAVSTAMFFECCAKLADVRKAVLIEIEPGGMSLRCAECIEDGVGLEALVERLEDAGYEVTIYNGKELF